MPQPRPHLPPAVAAIMAAATLGGGPRVAAATFGEDVAFLEEHTQVVLLTAEDTQIVIAPQFQGRVMTSTTGGVSGRSHGWLNRRVIARSQESNAGNPGGEDRLWLGPMGSQFSLFFDHGTPFAEAGWRVPPPMDLTPFVLEAQGDSTARLSQQLELQNHHGTKFSVQVTREIALETRRQIDRHLGVVLSDDIRAVGFSSTNTLTNFGDDWSLDTGVVNLWLLGMFPGTVGTTTIIPLQPASEPESGIVRYLHPLDHDRLLIEPTALFYRTDAAYRSKIGIEPQRATPTFGSYDAMHGILTIITYSPTEETRYPNNHRGPQTDPYRGNVIDVYNDGGRTMNATLHPTFYELESTGPAVPLAHGESTTHTHRTFHFEGSQDALDRIAQTALGRTVTEIAQALPAGSTAP